MDLIMRIKKIFLFILLFLALQQISYAESPLQIKTRAWPTQVAIGDEVKLLVHIRRPRSFSIVPPSSQTPLSPFEVKGAEVLNYREMGPLVQQTFLLRLTVFQLGDLQIPPFPINY